MTRSKDNKHEETMNKLSAEDLKATVEALLYLEQEPLSVSRVVELSDASPSEVRSVFEEIASELRTRKAGIQLDQVSEDVYEYVPRYDLWDFLLGIYGFERTKRLSRAARETLAIIAYQQPITKREIENIRGVSADTMIKILIERGFVEAKERSHAPGTPWLYGTTQTFLDFFALSSIADLPRLDEIDQFKFAREGEE